MTQERIDTSKYDGHTTTHWSARNQGDGSLDSCDDDYEHDEPFIETDGGNVGITYHDGGRDIHSIEEKRANMRLMADAPEILAELKRMYEKEDASKPCDCEDPDYAYYWHDASGCLTVIHGAAECTECGKAWDATQEGNWTIHFHRPTDNPYTG